MFDKKIAQVFKLKEEEKFDEAVTILNEIIIEWPNDYVLFALAGALYSLQDKFEDALPFFKTVLELNPKSEAASSGLFHCFNELGKIDDALNEMKRFLHSIDKLKKDNYKWILEELLTDIENPQLSDYKKDILHFKTKFDL